MWAQVWYDQPVKSNGIYFTTGLGPPSGDMSEWVIESSGSSWSKSLRRLKSTVYKMQLPTQRGIDYIVDWSVEQPFAFVVATNSLIFAAAFLLCLALALNGREAYVAGVLAGVFLLSTVVRVVTGLGFILFNNWIVSYSVWITTPQVRYKAIMHAYQ